MFYLSVACFYTTFVNLVLFSFQGAVSVLLEQISALNCLNAEIHLKSGGPEWTRTTDLPLIRRTL